MWDLIIKRKLNETIIGINKKTLSMPVARKRLDRLVQLTKMNVPKGRKRELKNDIFGVKKIFKL